MNPFECWRRPAHAQLDFGRRRLVGFGREALLAEVNQGGKGSGLRLVEGGRVDQDDTGAARAVVAWSV